jgi:ribose-phosphate pyrophosphokinase
VAKVLGGRQTVVFEKHRDVGTGDITLTPRNGEVLKGKSVIVVDDMVSSGATMVEAARACSHHGATHIAAAFVHPVLSDNALEKLRACCDDIVATNTIQSEVSEVDVSPVIAGALREIGKKL